VKIAFVLLHLLFKIAPLFRNIDIANLFLPFKVAAVYALTMRDLLGLSSSPSVISDVVILTIAAVLTGLLLPKSAKPSGAGQE
jgi:hypothetical protein